MSDAKEFDPTFIPPDPQKSEDKINPNHYQAKSEKFPGLQVMDIIEIYHLDFTKGNAIKYILRGGKKASEDELTDVEKAIWYLERRKQQIIQERAAQKLPRTTSD